MCGFGCNDDGVSLNGAGAVQGTQGIQGVQGIQGIQGLLGPQGTTGSPGTGSQGPQGLTGIQGLKGDTGLGIQGVRGAQGTTGLQGFSGLQGTIGPQGVCPCGLAYAAVERISTTPPGDYGTSTWNTMLNMSYTVPTGGAGVYSVHFEANAEFGAGVTGTDVIYVNAFKNATVINGLAEKSVTGTVSTTSNISFLLSNISLAVGDVLAIKGASTDTTNAILNLGSIQILKLS